MKTYHIQTEDKSITFLLEMEDDQTNAKLIDAVRSIWNVILPTGTMGRESSDWERCLSIHGIKSEDINFNLGRAAINQKSSVYGIKKENYDKICLAIEREEKNILTSENNFHWISFYDKKIHTMYAVEVPVRYTWDQAKNLVNMVWGIVIDSFNNRRFDTNLNVLAKADGIDRIYLEETSDLSFNVVGNYIKNETLNKMYPYMWYSVVVDDKIYFLELKKGMMVGKYYQFIWKKAIDENAKLFGPFATLNDACVHHEILSSMVVNELKQTSNKYVYATHSQVEELKKLQEDANQLVREKVNIDGIWGSVRIGDNLYFIEMEREYKQQEAYEIVNKYWNINQYMVNYLYSSKSLESLCSAREIEIGELVHSQIRSDMATYYYATLKDLEYDKNDYWYFGEVQGKYFAIQSKDLGYARKILNSKFGNKVEKEINFQISGKFLNNCEYKKHDPASYVVSTDLEDGNGYYKVPMDGEELDYWSFYAKDGRYYAIQHKLEESENDTKELLKSSFGIDGEHIESGRFNEICGRHKLYDFVISENGTENRIKIPVENRIDVMNCWWFIRIGSKIFGIQTLGFSTSRKKITALMGAFDIDLAAIGYSYQSGTFEKCCEVMKIDLLSARDSKGLVPSISVMPSVLTGGSGGYAFYKVPLDLQDIKDKVIEDKNIEEKVIKPSMNCCTCGMGIEEGLVVKGNIYASRSLPPDPTEIILGNNIITDYVKDVHCAPFHRKCLARHLGLEVSLIDEEKVVPALPPNEEILALPPKSEVEELNKKIEDILIKDSQILGEQNNVIDRGKLIIASLTRERDGLIIENNRLAEKVNQLEQGILTLSGKIEEQDKNLLTKNAESLKDITVLSEKIAILQVEKDSLSTVIKTKDELIIEQKNNLLKQLKTKDELIIEQNDKILEKTNSLSDKQKKIEEKEKLLLEAAKVKAELDGIKALPPPGLKCTGCGDPSPYNQSNTDNGMYTCRKCR